VGFLEEFLAPLLFLKCTFNCFRCEKSLAAWCCWISL